MKLETKVGAFFITTILILGVLILRTKKLELFNKEPQRAFQAEFNQVAGLNKQGHVRIAGVKVGEVMDIALVGNRARVVFSVDDKVPVYRNAVASLSSIGILGEKYIELNPGSPALPTLEQGATVVGKSSVGLDDLMGTLATIGENVKGITEALNKSIGGEEGRAKLDEIVDNIRVLTAEFRTMAQENHGAINATLANTEAITSELRDRLPRLAGQFEQLGKNLNELVEQNKPELKGLVGDVRKLAQSFQSTSENLKSITGKIDKGEGTIGKLLTDDTTVNKINAAVDNVNELLGGLKTMEIRLDMGGSRWTSRGDSRVGLGLDIVPRKDYWYALGVSSTPDGRIHDETRTVTTASGTSLENNRYITTEQSMNLSAEFAKRLGDNLVIHGGIIEGKGGAGAELRFLDDRFRFGALAYDFNKRPDKPNPRYRVSTSYQFWNGLYGEIGVQDIGNKDLRTFYVGGGLRWKDDDIKKLLGLAASGK